LRGRFRRIFHRDDILASAVGKTRKQTRRVAIGTNSVENDIERRKTVDVLSQELIPRVVKSLTTVRGESVQV
jgi:hypothetical protein